MEITHKMSTTHKMYRNDKQNRSDNTRAIKFNGNTKCYSRSCHPSITIGEGASNFRKQNAC